MKAIKDIFQSLRVVTGIVLMASLCFSCSDSDSDVPSVEVTPLELSEQQVEIGSDGRYYSVTMQVNGSDLSLQDVHATTDADWIRLEADTISRDGRLTFYVKPNTSTRSREGIINLTLHSKLSTLNSQFTVHQRCEAEDDNNAVEGGLTRKARVGYGYNMLIDYMNPECVTEPIIDYEKLVQAEESWGTIIAEEGRSEQSLSYHSSYSIEEMQSWMSKQSSTEVDFLFVNKSVSKFQSTSDYDMSQQTFGYSSLSKIVATRYIDEGKVQSIIRQGGDIFTEDFREMCNEVNSNPTADNVRQMVQKFGTHLVTYADLGGRLDYSVNFSSEETSRETVDKYMKYKNGQKKEDNETREAAHAIINSGGLNFDIYGGTETAITSLKNHASTKDRYGQVDPGVLGEWLNSIKASDPQSVSLVRTMMQPIWQLFTNQKARVEIINHILALAYSEAGEVGTRLQELGLDNYYQLIVRDAMPQFGNDANSTLVKLIYFEGLPKVEVCNEYVPELRGDRRVTIFYPIYKGKTNIRRGFFVGDGENAPAEVTFDNVGGCYVRQLEKYGPGDRLDTLYYIDGAFYPKNMGINIPEYQMTVKDETLDLPFNDNHYGVVKIGPGFWTRENIREKLYFGEPYDPSDPDCEDYYFDEAIINGMLYANVYYGNYVPEEFENLFEAKIDATGRRCCWFLPNKGDINALQQYIGNNCKALFSNQQSGFEAQFAGYYGYYDDMGDGKTGFNDGLEDIRYNGQYCFIVTKDGRQSEALVLSPDYTIKKTPVNLMNTNWYPIRAFRLSNFIHPKL